MKKNNIEIDIPNGTKLFRDNIRQMSHYDMCTKRNQIERK